MEPAVVNIYYHTLLDEIFYKPVDEGVFTHEAVIMLQESVPIEVAKEFIEQGGYYIAEDSQKIFTKLKGDFAYLQRQLQECDMSATGIFQNQMVLLPQVKQDTITSVHSAFHQFSAAFVKLQQQYYSTLLRYLDSHQIQKKE